MVKTGIGREGNGLLLDGGIDVDSLNVLLGDVAITLGCFDSPLKKFLHAGRANAFTPANQCGRVNRHLVLEVLAATKVLPVGVF